MKRSYFETNNRLHASGGYFNEFHINKYALPFLIHLVYYFNMKVKIFFYTVFVINSKEHYEHYEDDVLRRHGIVSFIDQVRMS